MKSNIHQIIQSAANIAIVLTLAFGALSLWFQFDLKRYEITIDVISKTNELPLSASRRRLLNELLQLPLDQIGINVVDRDFVKQLVIQVVNTGDDSELLKQDIISLTTYYDNINSCIENSVCDEDYISESFIKSSKKFACTILPYVRHIRDDFLLQDLGKGLANLTNYEQNC